MGTSYQELIDYGLRASYASSRDMTAEMSGLVRRAQHYVELSVDHDLFADVERSFTIGMDGQIGPAVLPPRMLELRRVEVGPTPERMFTLLPRSEAMLAALFPGETPGMPLYYARLYERLYRVFPLPYAQMRCKIRANVRPPLLGEGQPTNILTEEFPDVMEFAVMREIAMFNLDAPQAETYANAMRERLMASNAQVSRRTRDESAERPSERRNILGS